MPSAKALRTNVVINIGGVLGGLLLGYIHVFVLAYMALLTVDGYKYIGKTAFFLNGTASALLMAVIVGIPMGVISHHLGVQLSVLIG